MKRRKTYNKYTYDKIMEKPDDVELLEQEVTKEGQSDAKKNVAKILTSASMISFMCGGGYRAEGVSYDEEEVGL